MNSDEVNAAAGDGSGGSSGEGASSSPPRLSEKRKEKARVNRTSLILWHAHQNDVSAVRKLLEEDRSLVNALDYDRRTPLHVAALQGGIDVAKCLLEYGADVNAQDRWNNTVSRVFCPFHHRFLGSSFGFLSLSPNHDIFLIWINLFVAICWIRLVELCGFLFLSLHKWDPSSEGYLVWSVTREE